MMEEFEARMFYIARESLLCSLELTVETQNLITYGLITSGGTEIDKQTKHNKFSRIVGKQNWKQFQIQNVTE